MITPNAASITELKAAIEGIYILDEWNIDGQTFRPPAVEGRFVILNGNVNFRFDRHYASIEKDLYYAVWRILINSRLFCL